MKKFLTILLPMILAPAAWGQTILTMTTLSQAMANGSVTTLTVASGTGITAPSATNPNLATYLYIDRELLFVTAVNGTFVSTVRGSSGTTVSGHNSGAVVFVIPAYLATFFNDNPPQGLCVRGNETSLPRISPGPGYISDCNGGQWVNGPAAWQTTRAVQYRFQAPNTGAQNEGAAFGTSTAPTADSTYCTEIALPYSKLLTGIAVHIGATGGTDKWIGALYDSAGNLIAQSASAGTTVSSTAYAYQQLPFTAQYYTVGPGQYYGCFITNGTTATPDLITTGKGDNILTKVTTGSSFVLPTSFTAPTGFTTAAGAYLYVY